MQSLNVVERLSVKCHSYKIKAYLIKLLHTWQYPELQTVVNMLISHDTNTVISFINQRAEYASGCA